MKVFEKSWVKILQDKYRNKSVHIRPAIYPLALESRFSYERKKIENWFQDLPESVRADTLQRLRSENMQQHFGAFYELVTRAFFRKLGYSVGMHPGFGNEVPDMLISGDNLDESIVVEVATVFDDPEWEKEDKKLNELLNQLERIEHYYMLGIQVASTPIPEQIDYDSLRKYVNEWFDSFNPSYTEDTQSIQYDKDGLQLSLTLIPKKSKYRKKKEHLSFMRGLPARFITTQQLRSALRVKARKYDFVKEQNIPYIVALGLYSSHMKNREVVNQMFGQPQISIFRDAKGNSKSKENRASNGICKPNQNTRLSGVVTIKSEWVTHYPDFLHGIYESMNRVFQQGLLKVFGKPTEIHHFSLIKNPHARVSLGDELMKGYPQFTKVSEGNTSATYSWIDEESEIPFEC